MVGQCVCDTRGKLSGTPPLGGYNADPKILAVGAPSLSTLAFVAADPLPPVSVVLGIPLTGKMEMSCLRIGIL